MNFLYYIFYKVSKLNGSVSLKPELKVLKVIINILI